MSSPRETAVHLAALATATPPFQADQRQAEDFFVTNFGPRLSRRSLRLLKRFLAHPSIKRRCFAIDSPACLLEQDPDRRLGRFTRWAVALATQAALKALARAGLAPGDVSALVVNTCTGYLCPGLSSYLLESLGLSRQIRAYDLVGGGCGAAVPNLQAGEEYLKAAGTGVALCVAVEICSVTFQMADDLSLLLSNALFSDGAAAAVLWTRPRGLKLMGSSNYHRPEDREAVRYVHRQGQLYNQLAGDLPEIVDGAVAQAVQGVLTPRGLEVPDIAHWALHGGGEKVLGAVGRALELSEDKLAPAREIMARYGNLSSPSALFALDAILERGLAPQDWCLLASFGAGLSAHALLFRSP